MQNIINIQARTFPVTIRDQRTGEERPDVITLSKEQLQAAYTVGESNVEVICRIYNRLKFDVLKIGNAAKREVKIDLTALSVGNVM